MFDPESRIIDVDKNWYAQLMTYLQPEERWYDQTVRGSLLYAIIDPYTGATRGLVFRPKREDK